jgi:glycosyltransferase involved in cell wall biosynthesis
MLQNSFYVYSESNTLSPHNSRLLLTSEEHFIVAGSGSVYSRGPANYSCWSRYLDVFDQVVVLARVANSERESDEKNHAQRSDGPGVSFRPLPDHAGPWQYLRARHHAQSIARQAIAECGFYLLRVPGVVGQMVWHEILRLKKPYAVEVLGDPWDALGPGSWPHPARPVFRLIATRQLKRICARASALNYVTTHALQKRYPPSNHATVSAFSDVEFAPAPVNIIEEKHRRLRASTWRDPQHGIPIRLGFVGSFSRLYKGADVLLRAAVLCDQRGLNFCLTLVGDGRHLPHIKSLAAMLGIADRTHFPGQLPSGKLIVDFLDSLDLFVLPSRAEGMPRALLEAMARGCPCIATNIGGIPELLAPNDLVPVGNSEHLADLILKCASDSNRLVAMSHRNVASAEQFNPQVIREGRHAFMQTVKTLSPPP